MRPQRVPAKVPQQLTRPTFLFVCWFPKVLFLSNVHTHCGAQTHDADTRSHVPLTEPAGRRRTSFPVTLAWSLRVPRITLSFSRSLGLRTQQAEGNGPELATGEALGWGPGQSKCRASRHPVPTGWGEDIARVCVYSIQGLCQSAVLPKLGVPLPQAAGELGLRFLFLPCASEPAEAQLRAPSPILKGRVPGAHPSALGS